MYKNKQHEDALVGQAIGFFNDKTLEIEDVNYLGNFGEFDTIHDYIIRVKTWNGTWNLKVRLFEYHKNTPQYSVISMGARIIDNHP